MQWRRYEPNIFIIDIILILLLNAFKDSYIYLLLGFICKTYEMEYGKHADKEKIIKKSQYCFWSDHTSMAICQLS